MGCTKQKCLGFLRANALVIATLGAILLGIVLGVSLRIADLTYSQIAWVSIWGELFMRMLKAIILPLVASCLVIGITSQGDQSSQGRIGLVTFIYILSGNLAGSALGAILAAAIGPGRGYDQHAQTNKGPPAFTSYSDLFLDLLRNLFPDNIIQATMQNIYTDTNVTWAMSNVTSLLDNTSQHYHVETIDRSLQYRNGMNTMGVLVVSVVVGIGINAAGQDGLPLLSVIKSIYAVVEKILTAIFWYSPIGICSLIATALIKVDSLEVAVTSLGLFVLTMFTGFCVLGFIYMPTVYFAICRQNPFAYYAKITSALLAGFSPPSSSAALPYLLSAIHQGRLGVRPELADFVLPLETMTNRDGSAMFISMAAVFTAQATGSALNGGAYMIIILMTLILVMAVGTVPSASVVVLAVICNMIDVPVSGMLGIIMVPEFINDRLRTVNNVLSHACGCPIIQKLCPSQHAASDEELQPMKRENDAQVINAV